MQLSFLYLTPLVVHLLLYDWISVKFFISLYRWMTCLNLKFKMVWLLCWDCCFENCIALLGKNLGKLNKGKMQFLRPNVLLVLTQSLLHFSNSSLLTCGLIASSSWCLLYTTIISLFFQFEFFFMVLKSIFELNLML